MLLIKLNELKVIIIFCRYNIGFIINIYRKHVLDIPWYKKSTLVGGYGFETTFSISLKEKSMAGVIAGSFHFGDM